MQNRGKTQCIFNLVLTIKAGDLSTSHSAHFTPEEVALQYSLNRGLGEQYGCYGQRTIF
jgi:hypothetical protein